MLPFGGSVFYANLIAEVWSPRHPPKACTEETCSRAGASRRQGGTRWGLLGGQGGGRGSALLIGGGGGGTGRAAAGGTEQKRVALHISQAERRSLIK